MFVSIVIILFALVGYSYGSPLRISTEESNKLIKDGYFKTVLDVRTDAEYSLGHYEGAVHIPSGEIATRIMNEIPDKDSPILVYCNTGQRARRASELIKSMGYKNVRYIAGPYISLEPKPSLF